MKHRSRTICQHLAFQWTVMDSNIGRFTKNHIRPSESLHMKYFAFPSSSVSVKRLFSNGGQIFCADCYRLGYFVFEQLVCIKTNHTLIDKLGDVCDIIQFIVQYHVLFLIHQCHVISVNYLHHTHLSALYVYNNLVVRLVLCI